MPLSAQKYQTEPDCSQRQIVAVSTKVVAIFQLIFIRKTLAVWFILMLLYIPLGGKNKQSLHLQTDPKLWGGDSHWHLYSLALKLFICFWQPSACDRTLGTGMGSRIKDFFKTSSTMARTSNFGLKEMKEIWLKWLAQLTGSVIFPQPNKCLGPHGA